MDDLADLEPLAVRLEQSGDYRVLRRVPEVTFLAEKVYDGDCRHERVRIDYRDRFSDRF